MTIVAGEKIQPVSNQIPIWVRVITQGYGAEVNLYLHCKIIGAAEWWRLEGGVEGWRSGSMSIVVMEENQLLDIDYGGRRGRGRERN